MKYLYLLLLLPLCWACDTPADSTSSEGVLADTTSLAGRLQSLADAIKADPNNRELYLERAALFRSTAKWPQAMADLDRVLRLDTMDAEALALKGLYNLDQAKFNEAYDNYARCVQNDPEDVTCLLGQAEIELLLNKYSEAIELINRALRADEFAIKGYWLKGRYYKELEDTTLARSSYATVVEIDPTYADAYIQLGLLWAEDRPELSEGYYRSAIKYKPASTDALYNLAKLMQDQAGDDQAKLYEAMELYAQLEGQDPMDARPHFNRGFIHLEYFQHYDTAATYFGQAIERYGLYHQAYYNRGLCMESMDDLIGAERDYRQALTIEPTYDPAALALARVLGE